MVSLNRRKVFNEQGLVTEEEADELTRDLKYCNPGEWKFRPAKGNKSKRLGNSITKEFNSILFGADNITIPGLNVVGLHTKCPRIRVEKLTLTYNKLRSKEIDQQRIVQVEVKLPLPEEGQKSLNWPHVHYGSVSRNLNIEKTIAKVDVSETAEIFERSANIEFRPELTDCDNFELKP